MCGDDRSCSLWGLVHWNDQFGGLGGHTSHLPQKQLDRTLSDRGKVLSDGCQGWGEVCRLRSVVEAGDEDVFRHAHAPFMERSQRTEGHLVVAGEHGSHVSALGQLLADYVA